MRGGSRKGAGRPRLYTEPTVPIRIPESMRDAVKQFVSRLAVVDRGDPVCITNSDMAKILRAANIMDFQVSRYTEHNWVVFANPLPTKEQQAKVYDHPYLEGQTVQFRSLK